MFLQAYGKMNPTFDKNKFIQMIIEGIEKSEIDEITLKDIG